MSTLSQEEQYSIVQDLKVTIQDSSFVFPSRKTGTKKMFLSNIDQVLSFGVQTVHFFPPNKDFPPELVAEKLKSSLAEILVAYDFLGGRVVANPETRRLEVDCSYNDGAGFVDAYSPYDLDEIGDLVYPNPAFAQLVTDLEKFGQEHHPLCVIQVTSFKCGGFSMGITTNHAAFDGLSFKTFLENLAALTSNKPLAVIPCNDRHLLTARSPPRVTFPHHELAKLHDSCPVVFDTTTENLDFKIFKLTSDDISKLKDKASTHRNSRISGFKVIATLIWRCKALSSCIDTDSGSHDLNTESKILYAVDIRPRLNPPLPQSYTGNAVLTAYASATRKDLLEQPFSKLVEMVGEGEKRMTDEYVKSAIDWGEIHKGFPHGEVLVSSWWKLGFAEVEYPWGRPRYSCPVVYHRKDIILLFPFIDPKVNGVNVLVALPPKEMAKFQDLFHDFFAN